jgi:hypothetical protein
MQLGLKYNLRCPEWGTPAPELYGAAIEQAAWADDVGFDSIHLMEHHGSDDGYCPAPIPLAAAIAARTRRILIRIRALVLPLHDPVRVAEDFAVVDVISHGRFELVVAAGYVAREFEMFGRDISNRAQLLEDGIAVLKHAWTGEPFDIQGVAYEWRSGRTRNRDPGLFSAARRRQQLDARPASRTRSSRPTRPCGRSTATNVLGSVASRASNQLDFRKPPSCMWRTIPTARGRYSARTCCTT